MIGTKVLELKGKKKRFICMIDEVMKSQNKVFTPKKKKNSQNQSYEVICTTK